MRRIVRSGILVVSWLLASAAWADDAKRPNILLAIADDWSWPHAGAYGCRFVRTPSFDRVAREGVLFTTAFCASPGCSPSRAALLTGRPTWQLEHAGTHASSFSKKLAVYPDLLEAAGYHVGLTGKGWGPGNFKAGGRDRNPAGPGYASARLMPPHKGISATDYAGNFQQFLAKRPKDKPFCFWYGGSEPHRAYEQGSGLRAGKKLSDAEVPPFLPDTDVVRGDLLDYAVEIEWFDQHLGRMLRMLEEAGAVENTLVVVIADNGMPFPRAKANCYEYGTHLPLAVRWPARVPGGRKIDDVVSYIDLAPTFLEAAGVKPPRETVGKSLVALLASGKSGRVDPARVRAFTARERHSSSRPNNLGYPIRAMRTKDYLYVHNFAPDRWPAGDAQGRAGYFDIDGSPTKTFLMEHRDAKECGRYFQLAVGKRPAEELYDIKKDPASMVNVAEKPEYAATRDRLRAELERYLTETHDPHLQGKGAVFESYPRYSAIRKFD
jgi:N-sulfoglucosamine sulfohydrolase